MSIKNWPESERPREKLLTRGAEALSDAELLAIFLRTGIPGRSAVELARDLLTRFGGLRGLLDCSHKQFCTAPGMGSAKYAQLRAATELTRRYLEAGLNRQAVFASPEETRRYLSSRLRHCQREEFVCLFLDNQHQLIACETLFQGTINRASVHPREVVKRALALNAAALIVAHNHPSGCAEPSTGDIDLTRTLKSALDLVDVRLLDHMVVGDLSITSLAERGQMQ
ncbi:MAG: JAB domain-containing protein [Gammaproteobacteria bacterium]|nr:MAG: JAB domain-containing protein [Gammaproteobacteria bacterium]